MTHKSRLTKLERTAHGRHAAPVDAEEIRAGILAKLEAVLNGQPVETFPMDPARQFILERLERLAQVTQ